ncbi:MAG TPA: hypothetical protein VN648_17775 [Candidatus Methylomirabilis sp.]|nr:hypothetical protein [Candidatus Methylomirabilis sp.]
MARQEQDFNKETNRQFTTLVIKDSSRVTIDLVEYQIAQVLQLLLSLGDLDARGRSRHELPTKTSILDMLSGRSLAPELQDIEVNSLLQRHHIQVENCSDVSITMKQIEVEKVVEAALVVLNQRRQQFRRQDADDPRTEGDLFPV